MPPENHAHLHATVRGRVQGVSFRYFVTEQAQQLNLLGWVRNRWDSSVELMAEGPHNRLLNLLDTLHSGPPAARVDEVEAEWLPATGEFTSFWVRSSG